MEEARLAERLIAISVTGQGDGMWLIDKAGEPVAPAWLWLDARSAAITPGPRPSCRAMRKVTSRNNTTMFAGSKNRRSGKASRAVRPQTAAAMA